ncbi:class I SAM-dependent methyltransferase, partial [Escherichia coli]
MTSQTDVQTNDLEFTGERFMPEVAGQIAFEHLHRYHFASRFCQGKRVLDVACGEGYGSRILSNAASSVVGVDISAEAVAHAQGKYARGSLEFVEASAASLPLPDDSFDVVVSFETIEHHDQHEEMLS